MSHGAGRHHACHFRFSDEKAEIVKILNNGNVSGLPVLRTMMNSRPKPLAPHGRTIHWVNRVGFAMSRHFRYSPR
jgi:hypothetical protein